VAIPGSIPGEGVANSIVGLCSFALKTMVYPQDLFDYEAGLLDLDEMVAMFQGLIDNGMAWRLQGHYGRTAQRLIEDGYCHV
jgi:hypothetical protein